MLLIIKLYMVVPTWKSVDDTLACNIQVEAIELYFHVTNLEVSSMTSQSTTIEMKAIEYYFYMVLFILVYKAVLTFKFVNETQVCGHSNES